MITASGFSAGPSLARAARSASARRSSRASPSWRYFSISCVSMKQTPPARFMDREGIGMTEVRRDAVSILGRHRGFQSLFH
jgi:hypothetical protein